LKELAKQAVARAQKLKKLEKVYGFPWIRSVSFRKLQIFEKLLRS